METVTKTKKRTIIIAVAGNPNSGKSTLINSLSGSRLHVGNWPGVTVEKKEATLELGTHRLQFVDLPGTYSLSPWSQEEKIAREFLLDQRPDVILNVVDATNLERNLYLTIQLLELGIPMVMALNMADEAEEKGVHIDCEQMEKILGIRVHKTVATKGTGIAGLLGILRQPLATPNPVRHGETIQSFLSEARKLVTVSNLPDWMLLEALQGEMTDVNAVMSSEDRKRFQALVKKLENDTGEDGETLLAESRYGICQRLVSTVQTSSAKEKVSLTERIDRVVLHKLWGIPIFLAAIWLVFKFTFDISTPLVDWIDGVFAGPVSYWVAHGLGNAGFSDWFISLITDGVIGGMGFVLVFTPVIFAMMLLISLLESSGYMARAAFVMDRAMRGIGLHGKSFIPLLMGFGCNVPAVYATRALENQKDRILTSLLIPLMSCGARLPVYALFIAVFFKSSGGFVLWILYVLGIAAAMVVGLIFKKTIFRGEIPLFIMELPPYRMPTAKILFSQTWEKGKHFLIKAGTYILAVSVLVWFALHLPFGIEKTEDSYLGKSAKIVAPVFEPLGFGNWQATASLFTGIIAKEIVVGTMGEIYTTVADKQSEERNLTEDLKETAMGFGQALKQMGMNMVFVNKIESLSAETDAGQGLQAQIGRDFTPLSALSFMVFVLLYMPCVVTGIAYKQEFGSFKWYGVAIAYGFSMAYLISLGIFQIGSLLGWGV